jgi:nucleotide sugar dehydrogenase
MLHTGSSTHYLTIGIVGIGFVGNALDTVLGQFYRIERYDLEPSKATVADLEQLTEVVDGPIFLAVPTPMQGDGRCDTSRVESIVHRLDACVQSRRQGRRRVVVIKSTVEPGTTARLNTECQYLEVVFNPEFLTEANAVEDFRNQNRIILGGSQPATRAVRQVYETAFPDAVIFETSSDAAELVKYVTNGFLAIKVAFANEVEALCQALGLTYDEVKRMATCDARLGTTHWGVPGLDGRRGFGGSCLPKDLRALMSVALRLGTPAGTMEGAWATNLRVRPERDWEQLKGRAVT